MIRHFSPVLLFSFILLLHARQVSGLQSPLAENGSVNKVEGTVVNAQTGRPIPHALVEVSSTRKFAVLADSEGHFVFDSLPSGTLSFTARKPGFYPPGKTQNNSPFTNVKVGPNTDKVELRLSPESVIFGEVIDGEGEPVEGAVIEVLEVKYPEGRRRLERANGIGNIRTDEDGKFRIADLQGGRYYLVLKTSSVVRRIPNAQPNSAQETFPAVIYFPDSSDMTGATHIDLSTGQREHVTFAVKRVPAFKLAGVILGLADFKQVSSPTVVDDSDQPLIGTSRWDSHTGTFEFPPLPAGAHHLRIYTTDSRDHPAWLNETVTLDKNLPDLKIALQKAASIHIVVRSEFGPRPPPHNCSGTQVSDQGSPVDCSQISAQVMLMSFETGAFQGYSSPSSKEDPSPVVNGISPGKYLVRVFPMVGGHVHSLRSGGVDLLREPLIVSDAGQVPPIEVVLRDDGGSIKVQVHSETHAEGGRILLVPEFAPNLPPFVLDIWDAGEREYGDLPPGDYKVFAFDSIDGIEYGNPEVMAKYAAKSATVTVTAHGSATVAVDLIHAGE
jgi:protocatechuate 3,4-dioxygenase beta subunit